MADPVSQIQIKAVMPTTNGCAVFLGTESKTFVIYVDQGIGKAIQHAINEVQFERPQSHDLMMRLLDGMGAEVERVIINEVADSTFYARLVVSMHNELGQKIVELDARPSDSITLAILAQKPLYVTQSVLDTVEDMSLILEKILKQNEGGEQPA
ncbi:MAG: bifunctional nuclease family protein [Verrucomicrobia bacterium]|nr:bifunctional nuclease family protein [Verrucomicrobiota bacterium]